MSTYIPSNAKHQLGR